MAQLSAWERVSAALAGQPVDYPPVSIWRHFPEQDQTATQLADATLAWQARHPGDFVKLMPPGDYSTIDWGATSVFRGNTHGTRETTRFPVATRADWTRLRPVAVDRGMLREVGAQPWCIGIRQQRQRIKQHYRFLLATQIFS